MPRKIVNILLLAAFLVFGLTAKGYTESTSGEMTAFEKGLAAAEQEQWEEAAAHFLADKSHQRVYADTDTLLKLALTFDNIEGGDLYAAFLYHRAYRGMEPDAPNAAAIRQRIDELLDASEALARKLANNAEEVFRGRQKSYDKSEHWFSGADLDNVAVGLNFLASARIYLGDWDREAWWSLIKVWNVDQYNSLSMDLPSALAETGNRKDLQWLVPRLSPEKRERAKSLVDDMDDYVRTLPEYSDVNYYSLVNFHSDPRRYEFVDSPAYWKSLEETSGNQLFIGWKFAHAAFAMSKNIYNIRQLQARLDQATMEKYGKRH